VLSAFTAQLCEPPAEIESTPVSPLGTVVCPELFEPQQVTAPPLPIAHAWNPPTVSEVTPLNPAGGAIAAPQQATVPPG
jgi:hypothetical protein